MTIKNDRVDFIGSGCNDKGPSRLLTGPVVTMRKDQVDYLLNLVVKIKKNRVDYFLDLEVTKRRDQVDYSLELAVTMRKAK